MVEDFGDDTQKENLIGDDVANDLTSAMNDGQAPDGSQDNGNVQAPDGPPTEDHAGQPPARPPIASDSPAGTKADPGDLQAIKQQALQQLGPLVQHIDQEPEDRFNTLMMMIRASDDTSLVQPAYEAAQQITDDNRKAQALLDVVNEVNYLTRQPEDEEHHDSENQ